MMRYAVANLILPLLLGCVTTGAGSLIAQEEAAETQTAETQTSDSASDLESGTEVQEGEPDDYASLKTQWSAALSNAAAKYQAVQAEGETPSPLTIQDYQTAYRELDALLHQMIDAGLAAYEAEPGEELAKELLGIAIYEASQGHDLDVLRITDQLTTTGCARDLIETAAQANRLNPLQRDVFEEALVRYDEVQANDLPRVKFTTVHGEIVLELFENEAPNTVANFISLVEKGYYDGVDFHRVLAGFVAQGGDPTGEGNGGPGYTIPCECYVANYRKHFPGILAMAHAGRDTGGSQFYLTLSDFNRMIHTANLDGRHTVFGRVISGLDVVDQIKKRNPQVANPPEADKIVKAEVIRKRDHAYEPETVAKETSEQE